MPNNQDIQIRSEEVQEILSAVPNWMIRWGNSLILVLLFLLLLMTWFIKYPDIINTEVMVTTIIPPEKIYARSSGKFDAFFVTDNTSVLKDNPLAIIENTATTKDILYLKKNIDTLKIDYKNFYFPIEQMPLLFLGDVENSFALFETNYTDLRLYRKLQPFSNTFLANKMSINETKKRLQIQLNQVDIYKKEIAIKKIDLERNKSLFKKGMISIRDLELKELEFLREKRAFQNLKASISNLKEGVGNSNQSLKGNEIKKIQEENKLLKKTIQSYHQLKKAMKDWEMRYVLKASIDGKISLLKIYNKNQSVRQGDLVFTIIPTQNNTYIAKIKAPILNSGKIKIGQRVNIRLANYPSEEFGYLTGKIQNISLISDEKGFYLIDVSLPNKLITTYHKKLLFKQEMQGSAEIITEDLRLIERFFYQIRTVFNR